MVTEMRESGMRRTTRLKEAILIELLLLAIIFVSGYGQKIWSREAVTVSAEGDFIKWVDFNVSCEALERAYELDVASHGTDTPLNWIELLAYAATMEGGTFSEESLSYIDAIAEKMQAGEVTVRDLKKKYEHYNYYLEAYDAVLAGYVGEYEIEEKTEDGKSAFVKKYGLKAFSPIAKGFPYRDYDDFGVSRSFGYKRQHLGHDMLGQIGTPVIAAESGTVEAIGWNKYGGWRIGIRSKDTKRYYYYAHLRQNYPYAEGLEEGSEVTAGDVIGYMGHTGYSDKENVNNIDEVHLHFGVQLIFDESQKDGNGEIWIDCYDLVRFLYRNQSEVEKVGETREWQRVYDMKEK